MTGARTIDRLLPGQRVVIVGAGPAGLTAGYQLAMDGFPVTIVEADTVVGGISRTARYKGYRFDIGGHRFFTKYKPVEDMWREVLGDQFIQVPRLSRIYYDGKFFDYPLKAFNALRGLGLGNAALILLSYLKARAFPTRPEENFEQWVSNRFGKRLYEIFFKTYTEKVWGIPCTEIRAEWAAQRIQGLSLWRAMLSATSLTRRSSKIKTLINEFHYPRLGPGQMWELTAARIRSLGGVIRMGERVTRVELQDGRVTAVGTEGPHGAQRIEADHVLSTTDLRGLVRAFDPPAPEEFRQPAEGLRYRDFLVVALMIDRADLFPDNWIYIHTPGVQVGRIQNFNNWSKDMVPSADRTTCLGLEYFCFEGDGLWETSDQGLIELATKELRSLNLIGDAAVFDGSVVRMRKAYPIYDGPYRAHLDNVRRFLDPIPNLHCVGRNGMHKYNNQDHSMLTAMMTVWNMQGASNDVWAVNTDYEYHEEQKLETVATPG